LTQIIATTNSAYTGCSQESGFTANIDGSNHISAFGYDASGNATTEGSLTYGWNAESQLKSAAGVNYLYDGDGRRVSKSNGKLYWYGAGSEILAETDASGNTLNEYVFFGGKRVALLPAGSTAQFYVEDSLGTSRVVTSNTGTVCYDADFYPFGGERPYTNSCTQNNYKFEGKERDTETGNDDFGARYYSNRFGRWLSADWSGVPVAVPYANLSNPQTLNLYSMVVDDPESFADLDGHKVGDPATTCTQNTCTTTTWKAQDNNGNHTLTITKTVTTTTTNDDGSVTTRVNKTIVTFSTEQDTVGRVVNASRLGTMTRTTPDGKSSTMPSEVFPEHISDEYAKQSFGDQAWQAAQEAAMPGRAEFFNRAVRGDTPGNLRAVGEGILLVTPVGPTLELPKAIVDVGLAIIDLIYGVHEAKNP